MTSALSGCKKGGRLHEFSAGREYQLGAGIKYHYVFTDALYEWSLTVVHPLCIVAARGWLKDHLRVTDLSKRACMRLGVSNFLLGCDTALARPWLLIHSHEIMNLTPTFRV